MKHHYEDHGLQNKALPFIYRERSITSADQRLSDMNWHENIEILYIVGGQGNLSNNGHVLRARRGDIFPIDANHLHGLCADGEGLYFRYLIVDRAFCLENGFDTGCLTFDMQIHDGEARALMEELHAAYEGQSDAPYGVLSIRTLVLRLMLLLCHRYGKPVPQPAPVAAGITHIKHAIDYIRRSYGRPISLEDVAAFVGVSGCYLSHEFPKYTGQSLVEYVNRTRCEAAEQLLSTTALSVFEIARRCGFENRSYFAKIFRRYMGAGPTEYRAQKSRG